MALHLSTSLYLLPPTEGQFILATVSFGEVYLPVASCSQSHPFDSITSFPERITFCGVLHQRWVGFGGVSAILHALTGYECVFELRSQHYQCFGFSAVILGSMF